MNEQMSLLEAILVLTLLSQLGAVDYSDAPLVHRHVQRVELILQQLFRWRASARLRDELSALSIFSNRAAFVLFAAALVAGWLSLQDLQHFLIFAFAGCVFARVSFNWTFDHAATLRPILRLSVYPLCVPWCMLVLDNVGDTRALLELTQTLTLQRFPIATTFEAAVVCTLVLGSIGGVYYLLTWALLILLPAVVLTLLATSRWFAILSLKLFQKNLCKYVSLGLALMATALAYKGAKWPG